MSLSVLVQTWLLVVLAELGDKSQLLCIALAGRWSGRAVFGGAVLAFTGLTLLAVLLGAGLGAWLDPSLLRPVAGVVLVGFGLSLIVGDDDDDDDDDPSSETGGSPFWRTAALIGVAEMGDKTQIEIATLATVWPALEVFVGAVAALAVTSGTGVLLGRALADRVPTIWLQRIGGAVMIGLGVALIVDQLY